MDFPIAFIVGMTIAAIEGISLVDEVADGIGVLIADATVRIDDLRSVEVVVVAVGGSLTECICLAG